MINICIPSSKEKLLKQLKALKYVLNKDTSDKDREIHTNAIKSLEQALEGFK